ncbi:5-formaminoimidazole-4-carboxamide-1-(beta)-D-ribofuranosyl 5'-monophosphate synthetase [Sulfolobus sp. A20]|uniref:formate--phosphoribosylaminoimidazolecarboxamide ligase n=1 Tax=Sulfolobaceae TaxID=118883 RepID=UPI000846097C|nr:MULTISPECIES: formate--phosphoribosylaminoimidazolecarboxamide ligase [unclassified Sulfolobus]AOL16120.1 5-formaminoimidazole-4-carboxamide-1-(beta)-D-ribofuranosyl 5'-monophosphate synthetase [Sulfolobus sp. A20]TRM76127.1 formate--phosphoribosylaminoimidazolecarboxamide ligase [Sulfolobus sp. A20-N-F8]TRM78513.1 formate--phosphoribosylaminoimidazolecarboxamide ligase [Sulfolobus sp. B5]TRM96271.1 formate--phosphoribosylaminoimidazolecarboxamide ligase [Sulfolobus sp. B1]
MIIQTIGSHSSLQILHGAKKEGFKTAVVTDYVRKKFYENFYFIDSILGYENLDKAITQINSLGRDSILVPHGSLVEYLGKERVSKIDVKIFGNKNIFDWEANQKKKMKLLEKSNIKIPQIFDNPEEVDRLVIVKLNGAKGGKGYFLAKNKNEVKDGIRKLKEKKMINDEEKDLIIQEYVVGVPMYFQFFYSPILNRTEVFGIDIRYETNIDGLRRLPHYYLGDNLEPTFVVVGNIPAVARESLLPVALDYANNFVNTTKELVPPGMIGPFCLESIVTDSMDIVVFEFSGRIVAGTNLYVHGSPYSWLYWDEPMSMGRRIAREVKLAIDKDKLELVTT